MSALNNVLTTQTPLRPKSPAATAPILTSDGRSQGQGRSFEDTLSDKTDVIAANAPPLPGDPKVEQSLPLTDITLNQTDMELITNDLNANNRGFVTLPIDGREQQTIVTAELNDDLIVDRPSLSQPGASDISAELTGMMPNTQALEVSTPLAEAATTIPMADVTADKNRDAATPLLVVAADTTTVKMPLPTAADALPNQSPAAPEVKAASGPTLQTVAPQIQAGPQPSGLIPQAVASPGETGAPQLANVAAPIAPATMADVNVAKTDGATPPAAIPVSIGTAAPAETTASDPASTDRPRQSERAAETADYRASAKPTANHSDLAKMTDAPAHPTTVFSGSDAPAPLKSVPILAALPTLTPLSGMSDRFAATIMQTTNAQPTVTMDKLPQTVVAIALSAKSATLQIDPPELGRIQLDYQFDSQGRTVVTLTPESDAARAALMDRMATIIAALEQGSNNPVDVKLGDTRDFGSEFGQSPQDGESGGSDNSDRASNTAADTTQTDDLRRFMRAPMGEAERLHILV